ncbi:MAG TPA: response regulator [Candidatus Udaeobacter sp.]|nr:response regulator [Candidatus Udaeobacter sp.]
MKNSTPAASASPSLTDAAESQSPAVSFLMARGGGARRQSRRIAGGLIALALLSFVLLNFTIYGNERARLAGQHSALLAVNTEARRTQVRDLLRQYASEARYIADEQSIRDWSARALSLSLTPRERQDFENELDRAGAQFGFGFAAVMTPTLAPLAHARSDAPDAVRSLNELVKRCADMDTPALGELREGENGEPMMGVAVPIRTGRPDAAPIAVFGVSIQNALSERLLHWAGYGPAAGAYLVRRDGDKIVLLSTPPAGLGLRAGQSVSESDPRFQAASMAAVGVESEVETRDHGRAISWATTRYLPEIDWGIVGEDDRSAMNEGMRGTLVGLLMLDLAVFAIAVAAVWFWLRQYRTGLARREVEVTRRHAERIQSVFDTAFDAILTFDRHGKIRTVNRAAETLFGHTGAAMDGRQIQSYVRGLKTEIGEAEVAGTGQVTRSEALRADGTVIPVEFSLGAAGSGEERVNTAIVRDITERVESENRIEAFAQGLEIGNRRLEELNAQLEEASRLKSEFLANTSHELRTPLNGMIGFLQLVLDGMCDSPAEERDFLKQALQCSRHLLGLINDVLDIAKIEAGKLSLEVGQIDVRNLFDEVYTVTHVQAAQKGLELSFVPPDDPLVMARGDFGKVKQILINLVGNSLKFTARGSIRVRAVAHPDLGHVMFDVDDTGIGIPADRQKLVFEKFTQGDGATTRKYGGTGLGLAISRSLVELMGGIIGVQSDGEGHGTRMYFSLPVWVDESLEAQGDADPGDRIDGPAGGSLVMVVEDDTIFRRFLTTLLRQHGYRTVEARNAESGWVLARRLRPSVVVLDYALSCAEGANLRTGWDLAERMTEDSATRHIPLIFVTGFDDELRDKLRSTAFSRKPHHLMKPIDGDALLNRIEELVGGQHDRMIRILMADDDPAVSAFVRKVLPTQRFHLEIAGNGEECLHFLRTQPRGFDLLLLDLMMPQVSGYDVLREMTLSGTAPDLPVLVLTNFPEARNADEKRLLEQGLVLDVVPKTSVHDNPQLLPHVIEWQLHVAREEGPPDEPEEMAA